MHYGENYPKMPFTACTLQVYLSEHSFIHRGRSLLLLVSETS